jgi:hypothetical protein
MGTAAADCRASRPAVHERGQVVLVFALLLPVLLALGAVVVSLGNWYTHARHLQTKADAGAFAGGAAWGFPCGADIDLRIEELARTYVGPHVQSDGTPYAGATYNPQIGGVPGEDVHVVLNGSAWYDDDSNPFPLDRDSPASTSICESKVLDVKVTEEDSFPLFRVLPLFPDIKRKARVEIQEIAGLTGLLPIAVRLPAPLSSAAVFYDESNRTILDVKYFREVCSPAAPGCLFGVPPGLGHWTTEPAAGDTSGWATFAVAGTTGVVVATSFRPRCGAGTPPAGPPCLEDSGWTGQPIDSFCRQAGGAVQCYDANGGGTTQTVQSGVHFIRGYGGAPTGTGTPQLRSAYLDAAAPGGCSPYFSSVPNACAVRLNVVVDVGSLQGTYPNPSPPPPDLTEALRAGDVQVRYKLVRANGSPFCDYGAQCDLIGTGSGPTITFSTQGTPSSPHLPIPESSRGNAVAIEVQLRNAVNHSNPFCQQPTFSPNCRWFYTASAIDPSVPPTDAQILAAPIQRSYMGDLDRTGAVRWLRLTVDLDCNPETFTDRIIGQNPITGADAASQPAGECRSYIVEMGMAGGLARDQDEPPVALNLGGVIEGSSQRALIDCDPTLSNIKSEIETGCQQPSYAANRFDTNPLCPGHSGFWDVPKAAPFDVPSWPPFRCVLTQPTASGNQIMQGFNQRLFGKPNNPQCPADDPTNRVKGRNYWHRDNNDYDDETFAWDGDTPGGPPNNADDWGNELADFDPRLVTLFFTTYDSFTDNGNEVYPIVGFGNFYITGYGRTGPGGWQGGGPEDPCTEGNDGDLMNGNGNEPPPDLNFAKNTAWAWGHFVKDVTPAPFTTGGSGVLCNPEASFQPCVAVLVE